MHYLKLIFRKPVWMGLILIIIFSGLIQLDIIKTIIEWIVSHIATIDQKSLSTESIKISFAGTLLSASLTTIAFLYTVYMFHQKREDEYSSYLEPETVERFFLKENTDYLSILTKKGTSDESVINSIDDYLGKKVLAGKGVHRFEFEVVQKYKHTLTAVLNIGNILQNPTGNYPLFVLENKSNTPVLLNKMRIVSGELQSANCYTYDFSRSHVREEFPDDGKLLHKNDFLIIYADHEQYRSILGSRHIKEGNKIGNFCIELTFHQVYMNITCIHYFKAELRHANENVVYISIINRLSNNFIKRFVKK